MELSVYNHVPTVVWLELDRVRLGRQYVCVVIYIPKPARFYVYNHVDCCLLELEQ